MRWSVVRIVVAGVAGLAMMAGPLAGAGPAEAITCNVANNPSPFYGSNEAPATVVSTPGPFGTYANQLATAEINFQYRSMSDTADFTVTIGGILGTLKSAGLAPNSVRPKAGTATTSNAAVSQSGSDAVISFRATGSYQANKVDGVTGINGNYCDSNGNPVYTPAKFSVELMGTLLTPGAAGQYPITVTANGSASATGTLVVAPAAVTQVSPGQGPITGGQLVTIRGKGLVGATSVSFGGAPATLDSSTDSGYDQTIKVLAPAAGNNSAGAVDVTVATPAGAVTKASGYTYTQPSPPTISSIRPNAGPAIGGSQFTITGTGFGPNPVVTVGGRQAIAFPGGDTFIAASTPKGGNPAGPADVTVTTQWGSATVTGGYAFTDRALPSLRSASPGCGVTDGSTVTLTGTDLDKVTDVLIDGQSVPITAASKTSLSVTARAGSGALGVDLVDGGSTLSTAVTVNYAPCGPVPDVSVTSTATTRTGGFVTVNWTLTGDPLTVQSFQYSVDGGPATDVSWNGSASGSFTIPAITRQSGTISLTVQTVGGGSKSTQIPYAFSGTPVAGAANTGNAGAVPATGGGGAQGATPASAPCFGENGLLYPAIYGTVGSSLVMAPNPSKEPRLYTPDKGGAFAVTSGALPEGMSLDGTFGVLFGVPTSAGRFAATVRTEYADGTTASQKVTITVGNDPDVLQYPPAFGAPIGTTLSTTPTTSAAAGSTFRVVCGKIPAGLTFDARTGSISGVPTAEDSQQIRVIESGKSGSAAASFLLITFPGGPSAMLDYPRHPHVHAGARTRIHPTISGVAQFSVFRVAKGKLPKGLRINHRTGLITGKAKRPTARPHRITIVAVTRDGALVTAKPILISIRRHR